MVVEREDDGGEAEVNDDDDEDRPLEGYLGKLGDKGLGARMWKQRYVLVNEDRLTYAKKPGYPQLAVGPGGRLAGG